MYVHLPWCERKCPYCDFNSHALRDLLPGDEYIDSLLTDLDTTDELRAGRKFETVFFGGGTPSLFSERQIGRILNALVERSVLASETEITLEANPGSAEAARFRGYRDCGVNRLSIGVQSFDDESLHHIGRIHDGQQAVHACEAAHQAGFENFNIDLMFGLPAQDQKRARADVQRAIQLQPTHLSLYQLTIEPNTAFAADPPELPSEETSWQIRCEVQSHAEAAGYRQYEVSGFSKPGLECRHNLNYWQFGDYIGIGAGAHSKITRDQAVHRWHRPRHPKDYRAIVTRGEAPPISTPLSSDDLAFEFLLNALRLKTGFSPALFRQRTGLDWPIYPDVVAQVVAEDLLFASDEQVHTTALGWRFLDELLQRFLDPVAAD